MTLQKNIKAASLLKVQHYVDSAPTQNPPYHHILKPLRHPLPQSPMPQIPVRSLMPQHHQLKARNPQKQVLVHLDQGSQYTSHEWQSFLKSQSLEGSMSRRGNCHDNAVAESFFQLLKRERIKKKIYGTREEARSDIFDDIEMFYNSKRRHGSSEQMSPTEYESQYYQ